jgi:hypothetical protein
LKSSGQQAGRKAWRAAVGLRHSLRRYTRPPAGTHARCGHQRRLAAISDLAVRLIPIADVPSRDPRRSIVIAHGFDVAGGNYRLIAAFDFRRQIVFVKFTDTMLNTMPLTLPSSPDFYNDRHANPPDPRRVD